jgi:chorismate mutase
MNTTGNANSPPTNARAAAGSSATATLASEPEPIALLRAQIDALDAAIAHLIIVRSHLSHSIQGARMRAGGPRIQLSRERTIREHYRDLLGLEGNVIADAVLRVCRGGWR